jgi:Na+-transporting methylmalonyl-CoA/oxaloacetate decarboxylase gamma subunit
MQRGELLLLILGVSIIIIIISIIVVSLIILGYVVRQTEGFLLSLPQLCTGVEEALLLRTCASQVA